MFSHGRANSESYLSLLATGTGRYLSQSNMALRDGYNPSLSIKIENTKANLSTQPGERLAPSCFAKNNFSRGYFSSPLFSLPLMEPIVHLAKKYPRAENVEHLEDELLCVLNDAMHDPCSPWSKLLPRLPPVVGPRTPEQYLCALDIAINARDEARRKKKVAKYWKRLALQTHPSEEDVPLTPSPSDITDTDTGPTEALSTPRGNGLEELIAKRNVLASGHSGSLVGDGWVTSRNFDAPSSPSFSPNTRRNVPDVSRSSHPPTPITAVLSTSPVDPSAVELDRTLVNPVVDSRTNRTKKSFIPSLSVKRTHILSPPAPPGGSRLPQSSTAMPKAYTRCKKSRTMSYADHGSEPASLSPVQTKLRLYESLSARSSPAANKCSAVTSTPSMVAKMRMTPRQVRPQRFSRGPIRPGGTFSTLSRTIQDDRIPNEQHDILSVSTRDQSVAPRPKFPYLPQVRRGTTGSTSNKRPPRNAYTTIATTT